jgi:hypothetical protein
MTLPTFNGATIIPLPSDSFPGVRGASSIEWDPTEKVVTSESIYTGQVEVQDYMNSFWAGTVSFPSMDRRTADLWRAFILGCRGPVNCFLIGDPKRKVPKGVAAGTPLVSGGGQTGYSLVTNGWEPSVGGLLLNGDYIQIGYRLYMITQPVSSDSSGNATLSIWPNLRDLPANGTQILVANCKGIFRLTQGQGNTFSSNVGSDGVTGLKIREFI